MIDLVSKRILFILLSFVVILPGLVAIVAGGLKPGIDFTGGKRLTVVPLNAEAYDSEKFKAALAAVGYEDSLVKRGTIGEGANITNTVTMDIPGIAELSDTLRDEALSEVARSLIQANLVGGGPLTETITIVPTGTVALTSTPTLVTTPIATVSATATLTATGTVTGTGTTTATTTAALGDATATPTTAPVITQQVSRWRIDEKAIIDDITVGPTIGQELILRAFFAIMAASMAILIYLTIVFRKVPNAFRYGVCAIFALVHDVLVVLGVFAILGLLLGTEIDALFITAMMTVIGFSVHDTIVVFDRVRENLTKRRFEHFEQVVNYSLVQTLARSINTSITVILTLFALYLFGGASIHNFVLALLIGIISGTYSSIFNASMLLVIWEKGEWSRLFRGGRSETPARTPAR
ncbi:MAG: protein translocase subunit SecF [Chloroflexia bacterium]